MKIHSVRYGHAFNSSSTHSIIVTGRPLSDDPPDDGFHWSYFTASGSRSKQRYAAAMLFANLPRIDRDYDLDQRVRRVLAAEMFGPLEDEDDVDHQSVIVLPRRDAEDAFPDLEFFQDFATFLQRDDVAVLGGNDNDGVDHQGKVAAISNPVTAAINKLLRDSQSTVLCRRHGKHWVLFGGGLRLRMSFDDKAPALVKGDFPELVDIKITDFCPFGCAYCYQGSTRSGAHADIKNIRSVASALGHLGTLEVAIGGGEPTMHPEFIEVLRSFKRAGILPSFTTRNHKWFAGPYASETLQICGGIAFSVDTFKEAERWVAELRELRERGSRGIELALQVVLGTTPIEEIEEVAQLCRKNSWTLSLLGFKHDHRGVTGPEHSIDGWEKLLEIGCRVSVDTVIAEKQSGTLAGAGVDKRLYGDREGQFSMYIDAVELTMARASYDRVVRTPFNRDRSYDWSTEISTVFKGL